MNTPEVHSRRSFVFRPGQSVRIEVRKGDGNATTRLAIRGGLKPTAKRGGQIELRMPKRGIRAANVSLHVRFNAKAEKLHLDRHGVLVRILGSDGTSYSHRIMPGPTFGHWIFRILTIPVAATIYFCLHPGCRNREVPVGTRTKNGICGRCKKGRLVALRF